jgi:hypothetical protein
VVFPASDALGSQVRQPDLRGTRFLARTILGGKSRRIGGGIETIKAFVWSLVSVDNATLVPMLGATGESRVI